MSCCRAIFVSFALLAAGLMPDRVKGEDYNLDSLRLGANYLRWQQPSGDGAAAAAAPRGDGRTAVGPAFGDARLARRSEPASAVPVAPAPNPQGNADRGKGGSPIFADTKMGTVPQEQPVGTASGAPSSVEGMTLGELEGIAQRCNPVLSQAMARVEAARGEWVQAGLYPNPRTGYVASEINDEHQAGQQGAFFGQEIVTNGKLQRGRDAAAQAVRQAECAFEAERCRVLTDVRRAFYEALVAQRNVELTGQLVRIGQEGVRVAESLLRGKEGSRVDLLQARIEADSARILAERACNRQQAAWRNLAAVTGACDMPPAHLAGDIQDGLARWTWEDALHHVVCDSPAMAEAQAGVARAQAVVARECAARVPNVDLQATVQYDNATRDAIAGIQAGVPIPWFNRNQGNIRRAEADLTGARAEAQRVTLDLQQRLATVFEQYQNARYAVEKYAGEILPNAQRSLDLVTSGYRQGETNYLTLLTAQRTFFQVNLSYVEAIRDLRLATVAIEGNLLSDSLQQR
ncbi:MAG: TolC family protein [Thermoguttaceae bacterium]